MLEFGSLWWVVLLSAGAVWIASSIAWMVLPHHASDFAPLQDEDAVMKALGTSHAPRQYRFPWCASMEDMKSEAFQEKQARGPVGMLTLLPAGPYPMGKALGLWLGYTLLASFLTAYVMRHSLPAGAEALAVFRLSGAVSFGIYGLSSLPNAIWMGQPWSVASKSILDGLAYSLITGGIFAWGWPEAV